MVSCRMLMAAAVFSLSGLAAAPAAAQADFRHGDKPLMVRDGDGSVWRDGRGENSHRRHDRYFTRDGDRWNGWDRADRRDGRDRDDRWNRREHRRDRYRTDDRDDRYGRYDRPSHDFYDDRSVHDERDGRYDRDDRRGRRSVDGGLDAEDRFDAGRGDGGYDGGYAGDGYAGYAGDGYSSRRPRDSRGYDLRPDRERRVHRPRVDDRD